MIAVSAQHFVDCYLQFSLKPERKSLLDSDKHTACAIGAYAVAHYSKDGETLTYEQRCSYGHAVKFDTGIKNVWAFERGFDQLDPPIGVAPDDESYLFGQIVYLAVAERFGAF